MHCVFFAIGHFQGTDGDLTQVSQPSVSRIIKRILIAIAQNRHQFEFGLTNLTKAKLDFFEYADLPNIVDAIDGTLIKIVNPGGKNAEIYRWRKIFCVKRASCCNLRQHF